MMTANEPIKLALLDGWKENAGQSVAVLAGKTAGVGLTKEVNRALPKRRGGERREIRTLAEDGDSQRQRPS